MRVNTQSGATGGSVARVDMEGGAVAVGGASVDAIAP
jgi:hypothetical protein